MKWTYIIKQKTKVATVLAVIFGLMLLTNRIDKGYFSELQASFASVYQDRLLVESYIYQLSGLLHQKRELMDEPGELGREEVQLRRKNLNDSIESLVASYGQTQLTPTEARLFDDLQQQLAHLQVSEARYRIRDRVEHRKDIERLYQKLFINLDGLSAIQLSETKNILANSNRIIASSEATSQLEIGILIVVGLIIQALVLASKSEMPRFPQNSSLN